MEGLDLGIALIYYHDHNSFAGGIHLYKNNGPPPANENMKSIYHGHTITSQI